MVPNAVYPGKNGPKSVSPLASGPLRFVVLDFDGTLTDSWKEADGFAERYISDLAKAVRASPAALSSAWESAYKAILSAPSAYGWEQDGKIVAPAATDPFILANVTAAKALDSLGLLEDPAERSRILDPIYHANYALNRTVFKEGAADFLSRLMELTGACIVSGSPTDQVKAKLSTLGLADPPAVFGGAGKGELDPSWAAVPESIDMGLGRPVFIRRRRYWDILEGILRLRGIGAPDALVAGDIFELDLALPRFFGMRIALLPAGKDSAPERKAVAESGMGFVSDSLGSCLARIVQLV